MYYGEIVLRFYFYVAFSVVPYVYVFFLTIFSLRRMHVSYFVCVFVIQYKS